MVLSKDELINRLHHEVNILTHLTSKVDVSMLDYRPTPKQRSLRELLEYLTIFPPVHLRTIQAGVFDMDAWSSAWGAEQAAAAGRSLDQLREAIAKQHELIEAIVRSVSDADLRSEMEMFGHKDSRGSWLVWMTQCHYDAYRMQLFLYLKACGRDELGTMNLWAGIDAPPALNPRA